MIYKESEAKNYECRAPGVAAIYDRSDEIHQEHQKRAGTIIGRSIGFVAGFTWPRCSGPACAHWQRHQHEQLWLPSVDNWRTTEGSTGFHWRAQARYGIYYTQDEVPCPDPSAHWVVYLDQSGNWSRPFPDSQGNCELNFSTIQVTQ